MFRRGELRRELQLRLLQLEERIAPSFGPIGPEFRANNYTTSVQSSSTIAVNAVGDSVIIWQSFGQDGSGYGIYGQRYDAAGGPVGGEFRVNTYTTSEQTSAAVAMDSAGDFIVVWQSYGQDGSGYGLYAQRYDAAGMALGGEFPVNSITNSQQGAASVAMNATGDYVVAWQSFGQNGHYDIFARRYNAVGSPQGPEFQVNQFTQFTSHEQLTPSVAISAAGEFVIAWQSFGHTGAFYSIYARRYTAAGVPLGSEFQVSQSLVGHQQHPAVAADGAGDFVVAWENALSAGSYDVFARLYSSAGGPLGNEFRVNTVTANAQKLAAVAMNSTGDFVIAWQSYLQDGNFEGVYSQRYTAAGVRRGTEFRVNTTTINLQTQPAVTMDTAGDFLIAWQSFGQDGDNYGVYAQPYHANRPPTTSGLPNVTIPTAPATLVNLDPGFADADDGLAALTYSITGNSNAALFSSTSISGSSLTLTPAGPNGVATLTVRATDPDGDFVETSFSVTVGATAPTVTSTQVNGGAANRSRVTNVSVTFSAAITFAGSVASAFTLTRNGGGVVDFTATANVVGGVTVVTLDNFTGPDTEFDSLRDGRYTLTALASQISANGQQMASDYTFGDAQGLFRFFGDVNADRRVDISDFGFFSLAYLTPANFNPALDFNADGRIDIADFGQFSVRFFTTLP